MRCHGDVPSLGTQRCFVVPLLRAQLHTNTFLYAVGDFLYAFLGVFFDESHKLLHLEFNFTLSAKKLHPARCCLGCF